MNNNYKKYLKYKSKYFALKKIYNFKGGNIEIDTPNGTKVVTVGLKKTSMNNEIGIINGMDDTGSDFRFIVNFNGVNKKIKPINLELENTMKLKMFNQLQKYPLWYLKSKENEELKKIILSETTLELKDSEFGLGVFAGIDYNKGDIISIDLSIEDYNFINKNIPESDFFNEKNYKATHSLGAPARLYGKVCMVNHSFLPNSIQIPTKAIIDEKEISLITLSAIKDIKKGDQIFINYLPGLKIILKDVHLRDDIINNTSEKDIFFNYIQNETDNEISKFGIVDKFSDYFNLKSIYELIFTTNYENSKKFITEMENQECYLMDIAELLFHIPENEFEAIHKMSKENFINTININEFTDANNFFEEIYNQSIDISGKYLGIIINTNKDFLKVSDKIYQKIKEIN